MIQRVELRFHMNNLPTLLTMLFAAMPLVSLAAPARAALVAAETVIDSDDDFGCLVANTTYVINAVFTVPEATPPIPPGVTLQFEEGGRLNDLGRLVGDQTRIINNNSQIRIFDDQGEMNGTWLVDGVRPSWFGAEENGVDDDTNALQKAVSMGERVRLGGVNRISDTIILTRNVQLDNSGSNNFGAHARITCDLADGVGFAFSLQANAKIDIRNVEVRQCGLLELNSDSPAVVVRGNRVINETASVFRAISHFDPPGPAPIVPHTLGTLDISENDFENVLVAFIDGITASELLFDANNVRNCAGYILRAQSAMEEIQGYISFQRNEITDLTFLPNAQPNRRVARVLQADSLTDIDFISNRIDGVTGPFAANYVYWNSGNLNFLRNTCSDIFSGTGAIHDKGLGDEFRVTIEDNVSDQANVGFLEVPNNNGGISMLPNPELGMINIHSAHNVSVQRNEYRNFNTFALRVSHPQGFDNQLPENIWFSGNWVANTNNQSVIHVAGACTRMTITDNCVRGVHANEPRFVNLLVTNAHPNSAINDVFIGDNVVTDVGANFKMLRANDGAFDCSIDPSLPAKFNNIWLLANGQAGGRALVRFFGNTGIRALVVTDNTFHGFAEEDIFEGVNGCSNETTADGNVVVDADQIGCLK